jgi:hypothetical protein
MFPTSAIAEPEVAGVAVVVATTAEAGDAATAEKLAAEVGTLEEAWLGVCDCDCGCGWVCGGW